MRQYCILKNITNTIMVITIRTADMAHVCCNSGNRCKWNFLKKITFHKWDYIPLLQHSIQVTEIARNKTCIQILIQVKYRWSFLRFKTCNDCKRISNRNNNTVQKKNILIKIKIKEKFAVSLKSMMTHRSFFKKKMVELDSTNASLVQP